VCSAGALCLRQVRLTVRPHSRSPFLLFALLPASRFLSCSHSPNNIITSAVAADLASHPSVRGSNKSLGTVTGLINGCGSITASIGLLAVGPLQEAYGWGSVWLYLIGCTACGTLLMGTKIYSELFPTSEADLVV
jgi:hypothetical protein